jgi:ribose 5-phosphate isomerase B
MKIFIASDHAGFRLKKELIQFLEKEKKMDIQDFGTDSEQSMDYPDVVHPLCKSLENQKDTIGILICGSGNGVCMTANKYPFIRAALCWNEELASLARKHNNANVLCLPARFINYELAKNMVIEFLTSDFEGGRHEIRVNKIKC